MKNFNLGIVSLLFLISVFFLYNCKSETNSPVAVDTVKITKIGDSAKQVSMSHESHEDADVKCITCHHKEYNDDRIKKCAECHEDKEFMHNFCITCHTERKDGPTACNDCHKI